MGIILKELVRMKKRIFLIRHGESLYNRDRNRLCGLTDIPLSNDGQKQCQYLSRYISRLKINEIYSSPLIRALDSAKFIFPSKDIIIEDGLKEINYGLYEGIDVNEFPEDPIIIKWNSSPGDLTFPEGDSIFNHSRDTIDHLERIILSSSDSTIACVSHRTTIRLLIARIFKINLNEFRMIPCSNCSITELSYDNDIGFRIETINVTLDYLKT